MYSIGLYCFKFPLFHHFMRQFLRFVLSQGEFIGQSCSNQHIKYQSQVKYINPNFVLIYQYLIHAVSPLQGQRPQGVDGAGGGQPGERGGVRFPGHQHQVPGGVPRLQPADHGQRRDGAGAGDPAVLQPLHPARVPARPLPHLHSWPELPGVRLGGADPVQQWVPWTHGGINTHTDTKKVWSLLQNCQLLKLWKFSHLSNLWKLWKLSHLSKNVIFNMLNCQKCSKLPIIKIVQIVQIENIFFFTNVYWFLQEK